MVVRYVAFDFDGNVAICEVNITVPDYTPPKLSCPQSYVIELVDKQDSYAVNFNETRRRINATDASGEVFLKFIPERAVIPIRGYENVTVIASDKYGNKAQCYFQVRKISFLHSSVFPHFMCKYCVPAYAIPAHPNKIL